MSGRPHHIEAIVKPDGSVLKYCTQCDADSVNKQLSSGCPNAPASASSSSSSAAAANEFWDPSMLYSVASAGCRAFLEEFVRDFVKQHKSVGCSLKILKPTDSVSSVLEHLSLCKASYSQFWANMFASAPEGVTPPSADTLAEARKTYEVLSRHLHTQPGITKSTLLIPDELTLKEKSLVYRLAVALGFAAKIITKGGIPRDPLENEKKSPVNSPLKGKKHPRDERDEEQDKTDQPKKNKKVNDGSKSGK